MHVNKHFIIYFLSPLVGSADDDDAIFKYIDLDPNDEIKIKEIILDVIKPEFESRQSTFRDIAKRTLSFYLTTNKINFEDEFHSCLMAFEAPDDPKDFFIWMWEVLFNGESYELKNWQDYEEKADINEPLYL